MIAYFLSNISAKYYGNLTILSRVIGKTSGMFFETQCRSDLFTGFIGDFAYKCHSVLSDERHTLVLLVTPHGLLVTVQFTRRNRIIKH